MLAKRKRSLIYLFDAVIILLSMISISSVEQKPALPMRALNPNAAIGEVLETDRAHARLPNAPFGILVNGQLAEREDELEFLLDRHRPDESVTVQIMGSNAEASASVNWTLGRHYHGPYLPIHIAVASLFYFLAIFVYSRKPDDPGALYCHWISMAVGASVSFTWGRYEPMAIDLTWYSRVIFAFAYAIRAVFFVHFPLVFPRKKLRDHRWLLGVLYAISTVLAIASSFAFYNAAQNLSHDAVTLYTTLFVITTMWSGVLGVGGIALFIHSFRTTADGPERKMLRWAVIGFGISLFSYIFLWQLPTSLFSGPWVSREFILLVSLTAPIAFMISILRYRLFGIDGILTRASVYAIVFGILFIAYTVLVSLIGRQVTREGSSISFLLAFAVMGLLFEPLRIRVQQFVDAKIFRLRYNYREAQRSLTASLQNALELDAIATLLVDQLQELLQCEFVQPLLERADRAIPLNKQTAKGANIPNALRELAETSSPVAARDRVESGAEYTPIPQSLVGEIAILSCLPTHDNKVVGYLALGPRKGSGRYSIEDLDLLNSVVIQAGLAIERITLMRELIEKQSEAQRFRELSDFKSQIVSSITHDLKTPLSSIKLYAQLLERLQTRRLPEQAPAGTGTPLEDRQTEFLKIIEGESTRLTALIDNVLDHGRIERGVMQYHPTEVAVCELVESVVGNLRYLLELQKFTTDLDLPAEEVWIMADSAALQNILFNLITNAVKYSSSDRYLRLSVETLAGEIMLSVEDHGVGIPETEREKIFQPFYRGDSGAGLQAEGVGLGLSNVRSMMEALQGRIMVKSTINVGSTFTLIFPALKTPVLDMTRSAEIA